MGKIVIRHLAGSRLNQVDEFNDTVTLDLIIGRENTADIRYDPDRDDLVSRQHSKIVRAGDGYQLVDLESRNGTFLNRQRVYGTVHLSHNDVVQLGAGGPEFRFEMDPPPMRGFSEQSGFNSLGGAAAKPTRESWMPDPQMGKSSIGRATAERMLGEVFSRVKKESRRSLWIIGIGAVVIIAAVGVTWVALRRSQTQMKSDIQATQQQDKDEVSDQLKKQPAELEAAKQEVERLEKELKAANQQNSANNKALKDALDAQRRQVAALQRSLQQQQAQAPPPKPAAPEQATPAQPQQAQAPPAKPTAPEQAAPAAAADDPKAPPTYDALIEQVRKRMDQGQMLESLDLAYNLTRMDPERWEGFDLAAQSAEKLSDYKTAMDLYGRAIAKAPQEARAGLEEKLHRIQQLAQK